jgi:hypothetical protein
MIERLAAAINAALDAQSGSGDLRAALETVRTKVRDFAEVAAQAAAAAGQRVEATSLVPAVHAVMGDADAFAALRAGQLAEIPEGGALDFLSAAQPARGGSSAHKRPEAQDGQDAQRGAAARTEQEQPDAEGAALRAELEQAEASLAQARARAFAAQQELRDAEAKLESAEQQLRRAQDEAAARRSDVERTRQDASAAAARLHDAETAVSKLRARNSAA